MAMKTSILVFYVALFRGERVFRLATYVTLLVVNTAGLVLTFLNIFQCRPVAAALTHPTLPDATCIDIITLFLSSAPINIITDIAILFLPMPNLSRMRLPKKQKIFLIVTFGTGGFVTVVGVLRIVYLESAAIIRAQSFQTAQQDNTASEPTPSYDLSCRFSRIFCHSQADPLVQGTTATSFCGLPSR